MRKNYTIELISVYKIAVNALRIIMGLAIFYFGCNWGRLVNFFSDRKFIREHHREIIFNFIFSHAGAGNVSVAVACMLASALILFSVVELFFTFGFLSREKRGAIGLFVLSIVWVPFEILFVSKFLLFPRIITLLIDIIIIGILLRIILHFKKNSGRTWI